jgi:hypothetical protein
MNSISPSLPTPQPLYLSPLFKFSCQEYFTPQSTIRFRIHTYEIFSRDWDELLSSQGIHNLKAHLTNHLELFIGDLAHTRSATSIVLFHYLMVVSLRGRGPKKWRSYYKSSPPPMGYFSPQSSVHAIILFERGPSCTRWYRCPRCMAALCFYSGLERESE